MEESGRKAGTPAASGPDETLRHSALVPSHTAFVDHNPSVAPTMLPRKFLTGSFVGVRALPGGEVEPLGEFAILFRGATVVGHGHDAMGEFYLRGRWSAKMQEVRAAGRRGETRLDTASLALSLLRGSLPGDDPVLQQEELRVVLADVRDHRGDARGMGFAGEWFGFRQPPNGGLRLSHSMSQLRMGAARSARSNRDFQQYRRTSHQHARGDGRGAVPPVFTRGRVFLWPTPSDHRTGGLSVVRFSTPACGFQHTGTHSLWHGTGAVVRACSEAAQKAGVCVGDAIKTVNGQPLPRHTKSADVSKLLRDAPRPLTLVLLREARVVPPHELISMGSDLDNDPDRLGEASNRADHADHANGNGDDNGDDSGGSGGGDSDRQENGYHEAAKKKGGKFAVPAPKPKPKQPQPQPQPPPPPPPMGDEQEPDLEVDAAHRMSTQHEHDASGYALVSSRLREDMMEALNRKKMSLDTARRLKFDREGRVMSLAKS